MLESTDRLIFNKIRGVLQVRIQAIIIKIWTLLTVEQESQLVGNCHSTAEEITTRQLLRKARGGFCFHTDSVFLAFLACDWSILCRRTGHQPHKWCC